MRDDGDFESNTSLAKGGGGLGFALRETKTVTFLGKRLKVGFNISFFPMT